MTEVTVDRLMKAYIAAREAGEKLTREYKESYARISEQKEIFENELLRLAQLQGVTGFKVEGIGAAYEDTELQCSGADWGVFYTWMKENDALDMLERRIKASEIKKYMGEHEGAIPPGVNTFSRLRMKVRKS